MTTEFTYLTFKLLQSHRIHVISPSCSTHERTLYFSKPKQVAHSMTISISMPPSSTPVTSIGFVTGTGIPVVIGSQVPRVRVRFWYLAHRDIPCTRITVSRVSTGILKQSEHNFYCFETCFFSYLIKFFSFCHTMTQPNMALPAARTSLPLTIKLSPLTPTPILLQNVSHCSTY